MHVFVCVSLCMSVCVCVCVCVWLVPGGLVTRNPFHLCFSLPPVLRGVAGGRTALQRNVIPGMRRALPGRFPPVGRWVGCRGNDRVRVKHLRPVVGAKHCCSFHSAELGGMSQPAKAEPRLIKIWSCSDQRLTGTESGAALLSLIRS